MIHRLSNNKIATSTIAFSIIFAMAFALTPSRASANGDEFTTIDVKNPGIGFPLGTAFGQEATLGGNVKVLLDSGSSGIGVRIKSHEIRFEERYRLRLAAQEPRIPNGIVPRKRWPYTGVSYESMKVDFVTTDDVQATLIQTDRFQTPKREGQVDIEVRATTGVDNRQPPREDRNYSFKVTLRNVQGIRPDGSRILLGNFIVIFEDKVIFMHDPAQVPKLVIPGGGSGGGGVVFPPEEVEASGPPVEAGSGFVQVIGTLAEYLLWGSIGRGDSDVIITGPDDY